MSEKIIAQWWKKHTYLHNLKKVKESMTSEITLTDMQDFSNMCAAIIQKCTSNGSGSGLSSGTLIDMLLCEFLNEKLVNYEQCHSGECDIKINNVPLSFKKINGKSTIALDWSKNLSSCIKKDKFTCCIIILNLKTEMWWKTNPKKLCKYNIKLKYNDTIPSGFYIIDKQFCKHYIKTTHNNKTNTLIESNYLYQMLKRSAQLNLFVPVPPPNLIIKKFNILHAFL
jgi:hypothetical protein